MPLPFYAYSVAWGSVPIFIPLWWPHSCVQHPLTAWEMLPIFGLSLGFLSRRMADGSGGEALAATRAAHPAGRHGADPGRLFAPDAFHAPGPARSHRKLPPLAFPSKRPTLVPSSSSPPQGEILVWTSDHIGAFERGGHPTPPHHQRVGLLPMEACARAPRAVRRPSSSPLTTMRWRRRSKRIRRGSRCSTLCAPLINLACLYRSKPGPAR